MLPTCRIKNRYLILTLHGDPLIVYPLKINGTWQEYKFRLFTKRRSWGIPFTIRICSLYATDLASGESAGCSLPVNERRDTNRRTDIVARLILMISAVPRRLLLTTPTSHLPSAVARA